MVTFGSRLRELIDSKDIQYKEFAKIINVAPSTITNWMNGDRFPNDEKILLQLAAYFNVSTDYLLGVSEAKNNETQISTNNDEVIAVDPQLKELLDTAKELPREVVSNLNEIAKNLKSSYEIIEYKKNNDIIRFTLDKDVKPNGLTPEELDEVYMLAKELKELRSKK